MAPLGERRSSREGDLDSNRSEEIPQQVLLNFKELPGLDKKQRKTQQIQMLTNDSSERVLRFNDPRGPAGSILNAGQRNSLNQRITTLDLADHPIHAEHPMLE